MSSTDVFRKTYSTSMIKLFFGENSPFMHNVVKWPFYDIMHERVNGF